MKETVDKLFELQQLQFGKPSQEATDKIAQLRPSIPSEALARYDRLASRGRKPVALVNNGVCGQCHIRLAVGIIFEVVQGHTVICDSCGRILYPQEAAFASNAAKPAAATIATT